MKKRLRRWLALFLVLAALAADSRLRLVTREYTLTPDALPAGFEGFRIVQLSDLHGAEFGEGNIRLLRAVAAAQPDRIVLTGDLADKNTDLSVIDTLLQGLSAIAPVDYVSGNHEWSAGLLPRLEPLFARSGVRWLRNEAEILEREGDTLWLAGVEDPNGFRDMEQPDALVQRLREGAPDACMLLLAHRNYWLERYPALDVDAVLCGHAHGGVIRLPGLGGLLGSGRTWLPKYTAGVYEGPRYDMLVSRGLGSSNRIPRFLNNPEIVVVTLRCAAE